jgi:hypothetical protein
MSSNFTTTSAIFTSAGHNADYFTIPDAEFHKLVAFIKTVKSPIDTLLTDVEAIINTDDALVERIQNLGFGDDSYRTIGIV